MERITYGIKTPTDLFEKLRFEGSKLGQDPHPYDVFNFFITASVLLEWISKHYPNNALIKNITDGIKDNQALKLPDLAREWIADKDCVPNPAIDSRFDIVTVLRACNFTANASKHYHWHKTNAVSKITKDPEIADWYQYFFTARDPNLYLEVDGSYYNLRQIEGVLLQFYSGLLKYLEHEEPSHIAKIEKE